MEFDGEFTVAGTPDEIWKYVTDPDILGDAAPGCSSVTMESPSQLTAALGVGVGSVQPEFDVEGVITETDRPNSMAIEACGEASRNSFEVTARQELRDNGDGTTTVDWEATATVSGIIASMGERALGSVADNLVDEFFGNLEDHVVAGTPAESQFQAATSEEADAAVPDTTPETRSPLGEAATDTAATILDATTAVPRGTRRVGIGVALGGTLSLLWSRYEDGAAPEPSVTSTADDGQTTPDASRQSRLALLLSFVFGVVTALLWTQSQRAETPPENGTSADTEPETHQTEDVNQSQTAPPSESHEPESVHVTDANASPLDGDPLDRLESR
jgi:carbon monoxide dehydrogenase subunit G